jgi:hypothetical protein
MNRRHTLRAFASGALFAFCALASAAEPSLEPPFELVINGIVDSALDDLLLQMRRLPAFALTPKPDAQEMAAVDEKKDSAVPARTVIAVDYSVGQSGQPSVASDMLDSLLFQTARQKWPQFEVVKVAPTALNRVQYILGGKLTPLDSVSTSRGMFRVDLVLTEFKTSHIVAQASVRFTATGVDLRALWCCITH